MLKIGNENMGCDVVKEKIQRLKTCPLWRNDEIGENKNNVCVKNKNNNKKKKNVAKIKIIKWNNLENMCV